MSGFSSIEETIFYRRTIRKFSKRPIEGEILQNILEAGVFAPSACNFQAWKIVLINDIKQKRRILNAYGRKNTSLENLIVGNSHLLVITYRNDIMVSGRKYHDYVQSAAALVENILLMACSKGVGGCWMCDLPDEVYIKDLLDIPKNFDVIAFVALGYPNEDGETSELTDQIFHFGSKEGYKERPRKYSMDQVICVNKFERKTGDVCSVSL